MSTYLKPFRPSNKFAGILLLAAIMIATPTIAQKGGQTPDKEVFEAIGVMFAQGSGLTRMDFSPAEIELIVEGIRKGMKLKEMPASMQKLQPKIQSIMRAKMEVARKADEAKGAKASIINKAKAVKFFASLEKQDGIQKDASGFYFEILKEGTGTKPSMDDTVRLHYHGTLIDGTVFDSSVDRGQPASFPMKGVIKGFSGGLTKVKVGGKVRIYIPSELGYGDNPRPGGKIKPGDALIFECELLEIVKK
jgi:FKBP-type peptidyl-prolyl cis-trans isomerase FkpA